MVRHEGWLISFLESYRRELMDGELWIPGVRRCGAGPEGRMLRQYVLGYPSKATIYNHNIYTLILSHLFVILLCEFAVFSVFHRASPPEEG